MQLSEKDQSFVYHFGEMGSKWGFNRTVGQIYALLVISEDALSANDLASALSISRGNVSMGMKELQSWQLVQVSHIPGDRKEYYSAIGSVWDMANRVFQERRKREVDPTLTVLRNLLLEEPKSDSEEYAQQKMQDIHDLLEMLTDWAAELQSLSPQQLGTLMKLGAGVSKVLSVKEQLFNKNKDNS
ncbi:transcriptional regulator ['Osedax' symbiont bacterium Rs2_46_30_T18]|nr:transcriptional regulator ['Osedax' symbiont bacterium Rs2_46_30_T18]